MLTTLATLILTTTAQGAPETPNAAQIVGKMLAYYNDAQTMTGSIVMTQAVGNEKGTVTTQFQFERPSKVYIRQQKSTGDRRTWTVISDGKAFAYDPPELPFQQGKRLIEAVKVGELVQDFRQIYAATATGLGDRSTPLDIAFGRGEDLRFLRNQWRTVTYGGKMDYNGEAVHSIIGDWRQYGDAPVNGQYRMYVTDSGELKQFARSETIRPENGQPLNVLTTWDVKIQKNGRPDQALWQKAR